MIAPLPILDRQPTCRVCQTPMVRTGRATYCANARNHGK